MYSIYLRPFKSLSTWHLVRLSSTMSSIFRVREHTIPTCHIREYPRALVEDQEDVLQLAIKQYTPKESPDPSKNGVTIVGAHANGFPKVSMTLDSTVKY